MSTKSGSPNEGILPWVKTFIVSMVVGTVVLASVIAVLVIVLSKKSSSASSSTSRSTSSSGSGSSSSSGSGSSSSSGSGSSSSSASSSAGPCSPILPVEPNYQIVFWGNSGSGLKDQYMQNVTKTTSVGLEVVPWNTTQNAESYFKLSLVDSCENTYRIMSLKNSMYVYQASDSGGLGYLSLYSGPVGTRLDTFKFEVSPVDSGKYVMIQNSNYVRPSQLADFTDQKFTFQPVLGNFEGFVMVPK